MFDAEPLVRKQPQLGSLGDMSSVPTTVEGWVQGQSLGGEDIYVRRPPLSGQAGLPQGPEETQPVSHEAQRLRERGGTGLGLEGQMGPQETEELGRRWQGNHVMLSMGQLPSL